LAPRHRHRSSVLVVLAVSAALLLPSASVPSVSAAPGNGVSGFRALSGAAARQFRIPADVRRASTVQLSVLGLTLERYQQHATRFGAAVDGAQLTVVSREGEPVLVVGAHYPGVGASNRLRLDEAHATKLAALDESLEPQEEAELGQALVTRAPGHQSEQEAELLLDPQNGRLFYRVETYALGLRQFHSIDAETGEVFEAVDALAHDHGTGVKGDRKSLLGGAGSTDNLTRRSSGKWRMYSVDGRLITYDAGNSWARGALASDGDNHWTRARQRSAVDAHYYARQTDTFLRKRLGFDILSAACGYGRIRSVVRFGQGYANAFWDGRYLVYGSGDGRLVRALSSAQDVVAHELSHAVTECTSDLLYQNEPGALNEAFSDIMAVAAEYDLNEPVNSRCRRAAGQTGCPDWWIAEDAWLGGGSHGIRNLADPAAGDQPSHYSARYKGTQDQGGVHINSGIAAHAFYLMAEGGRNARCTGASDAQPDCDVAVPAVGLASARAMAFLAYVALPRKAEFCDARAASIAAAEALHPGSLLHRASASLSWSAVGVDGSKCGPTQSDFKLALGSRSIDLAPGTSDQLVIALQRGTESGPISYSVEGLPASWYTLAPSASSGPGEGQAAALELHVPLGATDRSYPIAVKATSASRTAIVHGLVAVDATSPALTVPRVQLVRGKAVSTSGDTAPVVVSWSATDAGSGVSQVQLEWSVDGGPWNTVSSAAGTGSKTIQLGAGGHRFRVRATDRVGNSTRSAASATVTVSGVQEGAAAYSAGWSSLPTSQRWGSVRYTKEAGRSATFIFTGREVGWVAERGPKRGKAIVYVDGVLVETVDLYSATFAPRKVVFVAAGLKPGTSHTLRIVNLGTSGRARVDVDGFLLLTR
jgi:bacillolysin